MCPVDLISAALNWLAPVAGNTGSDTGSLAPCPLGNQGNGCLYL
jgi:hypothetical protein